MSLTNDQLSDYEYWLIWEYQRLRDLQPAEARESINRFCKSCPRRLACGKYREMVAEAMGGFVPLSEEQIKGLGDNALMEAVERVQLQKKLFENFEDALKGVIDARLAGANVQEIEGERLKMRRRTRKMESHDTGTVIALAGRYQKNLPDLVTPRKSAVNDAFQGIPEALSQLNATLRRGFSVSWVEVCPRGKSRKEAAQ